MTEANARTCVVCCANSDAGFAGFPSDENRCQQWLKIIGNEELVSLSIEELHTKNVVCTKHFEKDDFNKDGTLKDTAVPKLNMSLPYLTDEKLKIFPVKAASGKDPSPSFEELVNEFKKTECKISSLRKSLKLVKTIKSQSLKDKVADTLKKEIKKSNDQNWTRKNVIAALNVYKSSLKEYKYLSSFLPLPTPKYLNSVLKKLPMDTGIDYAVLEVLEELSPIKNSKNKICALIFDEMELRRFMAYNELADKIDGFEDLGPLGRTPNIADCAGVFMIQCLNEKFKQPIGYYFASESISSENLAVIIKKIIKAVNSRGYKVITTVCKTNPINNGALKLLQEQSNTSDNFFKVGDDKIYVVYDAPSLFLSIRNDFYEHGTILYNGMVGKWEYLQKFQKEYNLHKISSVHANPTDKDKLNVTMAAQMLSQTVAFMVELMSGSQGEAICDEVVETALIVNELDRLFDITNGPSRKNEVKKGQREICTAKTKHIKVWKEFQKTLPSMKFLKDGTEVTNKECLDGYLTTLTSLQGIWTEVSNTGFEKLNLRSLNLDALENLFGYIRQVCGKRLPSCSEFNEAIKIAVLSNISPHSVHSNVQKDSFELITNFRDVAFRSDSDVSSDDECSFAEILPFLIGGLYIQ